jgi:hypothetical protein
MEKENRERYLIFKAYIERDPEKKLSQRYASGCQECNCQALAIQKLKSMQDSQANFAALAREMGISSNIYSHWNRYCEPILQEVWNNYQNYRYLLKPLPLSQWLQKVADSTWKNIESQSLLEFGFENFITAISYRSADTNVAEIRWKPINLGMATKGEPLGLFVKIASDSDDQISIRLRLCPTQKQRFLPPNLQLIVIDETGEVCLEAQARNADNWMQLEFSGIPGESFIVQVALGSASIQEQYIV